MVTHGLLHPLDTVKVLRQVYPGAYHGILPGMRYLLQEVGLYGLYRGWGAAVLGGGVSSGIYFGVYEWVRRRRSLWWMKKKGRANKEFLWSRMGRNMTAAACGNLMSSVVFVPKEVLKQRLMIGQEGWRHVMGMLACSGWKGWYVGWGATMGRNLPSNILRFGIYEEVKWGLQRWRERVGLEHRLGRREHLLAGGAAGALASAVTTPMDVLKTRFATGKAGTGVTLFGAIKDVIRERGVKGLYAGIQPRVLWAACFAALGFSVYETCKDVLAPDHITNFAKRQDSRRQKPL